MFAGRAHSIVCHLLELDTRSTICGLRVSKFVSSRRSGSRLHVLTLKPPECDVCKHCRRIGAPGELLTLRTHTYASEQL
jgi:hypothetical protein